MSPSEGDDADTHALGYRRVDDDPNAPVLLDNMDATGQWAATRELRAWERERIGLTTGQRLLDVGCGLGDGAFRLADLLGPEGEIVGVDVSAEMVRAAEERARAVPCRVRLSVGDALHLLEPDGSVDAVRSERVLQWLPDPERAVAGMGRVVRPGGRVSLIDSDWSTFAIDVGDLSVAEAIRRALATERRRPSNVGSRLHVLVRAAGLDVVDRTEATQHWDSWNPDETPAPAGCFSMQSLADDVAEAGELDPAGRADFVATILDAARAGRFSMRLTMYAVIAQAPASRSQSLGS